MYKLLSIFVVTVCLFVGTFLILQNRLLPPIILAKPVPASNYSAWIPNWDQEKVITSLQQSNGKLTFISPVWYQLTATAEVQEVNKIEKIRIKEIANTQAMKTMPTIFNDFDARRVSVLIKDPVLIESFSKRLIEIAQEEGYVGWDIDFEQLDLQDRDNFSNFIKVLAEELHQEQLLLSVSVHVQTGKSSDWESAKTQAWPALTKSVDYLRIMAYDFHNSNTSAGAITPIDRYKEVLRYATSIIPIEKLVVGLPLYGYNWDQDKADPVDYLQTQKLATEFNFQFQRDKNSQALTGSYKDKDVEHTIWIEDSQSLISKINTARFFGIYQFCFWRLAGEDPQLWSQLP